MFRIIPRSLPLQMARRLRQYACWDSSLLGYCHSAVWIMYEHTRKDTVRRHIIKAAQHGQRGYFCGTKR